MTEITQADRDLFIQINDIRDFDDVSVQRINEGRWFTHEVELIARHREQAIAEIKRERDQAVEALREIAQNDYGYANVLEEGLPPEKHTEYFCSMVTWRQRLARTILASIEGTGHE